VYGLYLAQGLQPGLSELMPWQCVPVLSKVCIPSASQEVSAGFVLGRVVAAGDTAVNVPVITCLACVCVISCSHSYGLQSRHAMVNVPGSFRLI